MQWLAKSSDYTQNHSFSQFILVEFHNFFNPKSFLLVGLDIRIKQQFKYEVTDKNLSND